MKILMEIQNFEGLLMLDQGQSRYNLTTVGEFTLGNDKLTEEEERLIPLK